MIFQYLRSDTRPTDTLRHVENATVTLKLNFEFSFSVRSGQSNSSSISASEVKTYCPEVREYSTHLLPKRCESPNLHVSIFAYDHDRGQFS